MQQIKLEEEDRKKKEEEQKEFKNNNDLHRFPVSEQVLKNASWQILRQGKCSVKSSRAFFFFFFFLTKEKMVTIVTLGECNHDF